jgi:hypothetical protein
VLRTEAVLGGFFLATWIVALVYGVGWLEAPGLALSLYGLFSFAAAFGWVVGNLYVLRLRSLPAEARALRRRFGILYLAVPAGVVALARAMAPLELRIAAPLAEPLALGVYTIFFMVPLSLRRRA